jgi:hypothetical protein
VGLIVGVGVTGIMVGTGVGVNVGFHGHGTGGNVGVVGGRGVLGTGGMPYWP